MNNCMYACMYACMYVCMYESMYEGRNRDPELEIWLGLTCGPLFMP